MKISYLLLIFILISPLTLLQNCKSVASVSCVNVQQFQSNSGVLNSNMFANGDILLLDTIRKVGTRIFTLEIQSSDLSSTNPIDTFEILTETGFEIQLSGRIAKGGSDQVKTQAKSRITKETTFFLENSVRKNVKNPESVISSSPVNSQLVRNIRDNPNNIAFMITGIVYADNFDFRIKKSSEFKGEANVMKVGDFKLDVSFNCQGSIVVNSKQGGIFYKGTFFKVLDNRIATINPSVNLSKYDLILAPRPR